MSNRIELSADVRIPREIARQGTLAGWQAAVEAALTALNCPHWTLGAASGFVGSIVQLCRFDTCGINFSGPSSCGKTLAQQLAVSAWTCPRLTSGGLLRPANFTANSIELLARQSNGTVLGLDELALIDGKTFGQVIYGLAAGVGKARMTVGLKLQRPIKWSTFVVLSCERTLEHKIKSDGGRWSGGMAARFADIDCSDVNRKVPAKTIAAIGAMQCHYGEAGISFIRQFMAEDLHRDPEALRQRIVTMANTLAGGDVVGAQVRAALPFALLDICGELARAFSVLPKTADIKGAVQWAWNGFTGSSGAGALEPEKQAEANLRRHVAEHRDITIKKTELGVLDAHNNRDAIGWYDDKAVYIPVDRIADAAGGVLSERAIGRMLAERQLLARHKKNRLTVDYVPKIGFVPSYALKLAEFSPRTAFESDDDE
jgi:Domain of unknown function (DUF927)